MSANGIKLQPSDRQRPTIPVFLSVRVAKRSVASSASSQPIRQDPATETEDEGRPELEARVRALEKAPYFKVPPYASMSEAGNMRDSVTQSVVASTEGIVNETGTVESAQVTTIAAGSTAARTTWKHKSACAGGSAAALGRGRTSVPVPRRAAGSIRPRPTAPQLVPYSGRQ